MGHVFIFIESSEWSKERKRKYNCTIVAMSNTIVHIVVAGSQLEIGYIEMVKHIIEMFWMLLVCLAQSFV